MAEHPSFFFDYSVEKSPWTRAMYRQQILGVVSRKELEELLNECYPTAVRGPIAQLLTLPREAQLALFDSSKQPYLAGLIFHTFEEEDPQTDAMIRLTGRVEPFILKTYLTTNERYAYFPFELLAHWNEDQWKNYICDMMFYQWDQRGSTAVRFHRQVLDLCYEHMGPAWMCEHAPNVRALQLMSEGVYQFSDELLAKALVHENPLVRAHVACMYYDVQRSDPQGLRLQCQQVFEGALREWADAMQRSVQVYQHLRVDGDGRGDEPTAEMYLRAAQVLHSPENLHLPDASDVFGLDD